jgi:hypothetical protein
LECLEFFEKEKRNEANLAAYTDAIGWSGLFNGFAGKDSKKTSPADLLPFGQEINKEDQRISDRTFQVLKKLFKTQKLKPQVMGVLAYYLEN